MAYSGIVLSFVKGELENKIREGRVEKIHQPGPLEIVLWIHQRNNYRLNISAHPKYSRIHLTGQNNENPPSPPPFCMLLRKHLTGGRIISIEQEGLDRIMKITVRTRDEFQLVEEKTLVIEIMGKHSNIILLDQNNTILGSIKTVTEEISRYRKVMPGISYIIPPHGEKLNLSEMEEIQWLKLHDLLAQNPDEKISRGLIGLFNGLDPLLAEEITYRAGLEPQKIVRELAGENLKNLADSLNSLRETILQGKGTPLILTNDKGDYQDFTCIQLTKHPDHQKIFFDTTNEMLDRFFDYRIKQDKYSQLKQHLQQLVNHELKKARQKSKGLEEKLKKSNKFDKFRLWGELLTAQLHLAEKGQEKVQVVNYYHPQQEKITITLDPRLSPAENAQKFFKKYRKLKKAQPLVKKDLKKTREEVRYLEGVKYNLEEGSLEDTVDIKEELSREGYLKTSRKHKKTKEKERDKAPRPLKFLSSEGLEIYVGKNNRQNEFLTLKIASKEDLWLHAKDIPGSHVVVKGENVPPQTLKEAALLAAYYSKASGSSNVPVDYTKIKHVRKPRQARTGMVIYDHHKTIYVTPGEKEMAGVIRV